MYMYVVFNLSIWGNKIVTYLIFGNNNGNKSAERVNFDQQYQYKYPSFSYNKHVGKEYLVYLHCACAFCAARFVNI